MTTTVRKRAMTPKLAKALRKNASQAAEAKKMPFEHIQVQLSLRTSHYEFLMMLSGQIYCPKGQELSRTINCIGNLYQAGKIPLNYHDILKPKPKQSQWVKKHFKMNPRVKEIFESVSPDRFQDGKVERRQKTSAGIQVLIHSILYDKQTFRYLFSIDLDQYQK